MSRPPPPLSPHHGSKIMMKYILVKRRQKLGDFFGKYFQGACIACIVVSGFGEGRALSSANGVARIKNVLVVTQGWN